jgi:opacity protein-like surface antigen
MKRAMTILAVAAAGAFTASAPAQAADESTADRIVSSIYADLGMNAKADEPQQQRGGFFVGLHAGLGADTGIAPIAAGLSIPLLDEGAESITANGYYVYSPGWSLDTYVGGGFGKMNLGDQPLLMNEAMPRGTFAYQGMAGVTYSFTRSMTLGIEYRYSEQLNNPLFQQNALPRDDERDQSVTLRFDFLLN